jgi:zinc protease
MSLRRIAAVGLCAALSGQTGAEPVETWVLGNGLRVMLRPLQGAPKVALLVLYDIGEAHDPPGRSGLGHLIEHCYVTAAAGDRPASSAQDWFTRYEGQANAQTGRLYTVIACVFDRALLGEELADAAARMRGLRVEAADLERERPRMDQELSNMYGGIPALAARNLATDAVAPLPGGGRKGGVPEQVAEVTPGEIRERLAAYYTPANATLVLVGGFEAPQTRPLIESLFSGIPAGTRLQRPPQDPPPRPEALRSATVEPADFMRQPEPVAALAFRAPAPEGGLYAPFLVAVARLTWRLQPEIEQAMRRPSQIMPIWFTPVDQPEVLILSTQVRAGESDQDAVSRLRGLVGGAVAPPEGEDPGAALALQQFGFLLGLIDVQDRVAAQNPYGVGFSLGRRAQMGIDAQALRAAVSSVTAADLGRCAEEVFAPRAGAAVVVRPR